MQIETTRNQGKRKYVFLLALLLAIELVFSIFPIMTVAAGETSYSNVLDDLKKDPNFNVEDYPSIAIDYSLKVIQIAESVDNELFVYVYQPSGEAKYLRALYLNMSLEETTPGEAVVNKLYKLTFLNSNGVFYKYVVEDFNVSEDTYRFYNIASVYREYNELLGDIASEAIDNIQCKGFEVGLFFCAYYLNGELVYESEKVDVVDIDINASGSISYTEGFFLASAYCDSHYIGFDVMNYSVDKIIDADIAYSYVPVREEMQKYGRIEKTYGKEESVPTQFLSNMDSVVFEGEGIFGKKYTWKRIQTIEDFLKEVEENAEIDSFSEDEISDLEKCKFVFRFLETTRVHVVDPEGFYYDDYTEIMSYGILRLHFLVGNKVYNLGCVSDLVGIDGTPDLTIGKLDNIINALEEGFDILKIILFIIGFILLIVFLWFISKPLKFIWDILKTVFHFTCFIIFYPFKLVFSLFFGKKRAS